MMQQTALFLVYERYCRRIAAVRANDSTAYRQRDFYRRGMRSFQISNL
ncbi:MAG: hypothetical protein ACFNMB_00145 [Candidatus Saccharimonas sp.]|nr:hypothetical protein [Candidatus Saccharibacteria bacterium]